MTKRNSNKQADSNGSKIKSSNPVLSASLLTIGVAWLSLLMTSAYLGLLRQPLNDQQQITQISQALAGQQNAALTAAIDQHQAQLGALAKNPELQNLLLMQDLPKLEQIRQQYQFIYPNITSLRLIPLGPLGIAGLGKNNISLRNNIEVDMIRKASQGEHVPVELYQYDNQWLISFAQPVVSNDKIVGASLLTLNRHWLETILNRFDTNLGQTQLQLSGNSPRQIAKTAGQGVNTKAYTLDMAYKGWQIVFTPSQQVIQTNSHSALPAWIALGITAILISLTALFNYRQINQSIRQNFDRLISYAQELSTKTKTSNPGFSMMRFTEAAEHMTQLRRMDGPESTSKPKVAAPKKDVKAPELDLDETLFDEELPDLDDMTSFDDVLDLDDTLDVSETQAPVLNEQIFRAYDIRGIADEDLDDQTCYHLGLAIGSEATDLRQTEIVIACDGRQSSPSIKETFKKGLLDAGMEVIDIGTVPTPLLYFATHQLNTHTGVMVTGSHNPPEYNGFKVVINDQTLTYNAIQDLKQRIQTQNYHRGQGSQREESIIKSYIDTIIGDVAIAQPLKVVIDCGNGVAGIVAPALIEELGCEVVPLYCEVDGNFPNHHPDPSKSENLQDLISAVQEHDADIGIAFDGDADRLGVVSRSGNIIMSDRLLMLFAQDVVSRNPGTDVIFDVKSTRHLNTLISSYGGRPIMWKSGHSYIKEKMQETGALLGGEFSGHIFFKERWYGFDDGIYSAARLIEILSMSDPDLDNQLSVFPTSICTEELHIAVNEEDKFSIMEQLIKKAQFDDAKLSDLDGLRVDFPDGWGLVRASNTTPVLTLRFEAETDDALKAIQQRFKDLLLSTDDSLSIPF